MFGTPAKPTGFGFTGFGTATTTTAPTFGTGTPAVGFGATPTSTPAATGFGMTFGQPANTATPGTGFTFGQPAAPTGTGFTFGQPGATTFVQPAAATTTTGFTFGQPAATAATGFGFGQPAATTTTGFSFGQPAAGQTATTTTAFTFGQPTTATANTGFTFGQPTATGTGFGFGAQPSTAAPTFNFGGTSATTTAAPTFSFGAPATTAGSTGFQFGGFGANTTTTQSNPFGGTSLFSTGFGTSAAPSFGGAAPAAGTAAAAASAASNLTNLATALSLPTVFNDERDNILAKWNQLQAFWGTGKGYFSATAPPVVFTTENPFCRFKAIGYSRLPQAKPEDGLLALLFEKKLEDVQPLQAQLVEGLQRALGNKPNVAVCVEGLKSLDTNRCELVVYIMERAPTGQTRRFPSNEVVSYLEQATVKPQLTSMGVHSVISKAAATKEWLKGYLSNPPCGIDTLLWEQAKLDNPDPERLIPVPMIGFAELRRRFKLQEHEIKQHQCRLDAIAEDISKLQIQHTNTVAKIEEHKRKQQNLYHRILKVMVHHEVSRKMGFAIQPEEEQLRTMLESNLAELSAPTQFRGRLNELMSQIKLQNNQMTFTDSSIHCSLDPNSLSQLKEHLHNQQKGIFELVKIIKDDLEELKEMETSLQVTAAPRR
uniref:Putative nucleoporin 54 n=1 Tax=Rhipicephalus pulchellus TaxID=72859 RepID=L7M7C8_RHIPC